MMNRILKLLLVTYGIGVIISFIFWSLKNIFFYGSALKVIFLIFYFSLTILLPIIALIITKENNFKDIVIAIILFNILSVLLVIPLNTFYFNDFLNSLAPSPLSITEYTFCYDSLAPIDFIPKPDCFFYKYLLIKSFVLALVIMLIASYLFLIINKKRTKR